jgi:glycosyltransferase involved in cell wall biosynthesis
MNKNIIFLNTHFYPPRTGGERYDWEIAQFLEKKGFNIYYITEDKPPFFIRYGTTTSFYLIWHLAITPNRITIIQDASPHIRYLFANLLFKLFTNIKQITIIHHPNFPFRKYNVFRMFERFTQRLQLILSDRIITNSKYTKKQMTEMGIKADKIFIIPPAVDYPNKTYREKEFPETPTIFFLGNITPRKGLLYLLQALSNLKNYDWELIIAGDENLNKEYTTHCEEFIKNASIKNRINFLGYTEKSKIHEIFKETDIFILPSCHEGYGMVIKEAASFGVPIITTRVGAIPEIVEHGESAFLIPPEDPDAIKNAIVNLLEDENLRKKIAKGAFDSVDFSYTWETAGKKFFRYIKRYILRNN